MWIAERQENEFGRLVRLLELAVCDAFVIKVSPELLDFGRSVMCTVKTLKPGQKGTKELLTRFGPSLLCVRYRYDEHRREHVKTVELVVLRRSRDGEAECPGSRKFGSKTLGAWAGGVATRRVAQRIGWRGRGLQRRVKSAGGRWQPGRRVWILHHDAAEPDASGGRWGWLDMMWPPRLDRGPRG